MSRARVVIVQERLLQYRQRFFELLRDHLADRGVELVLIHSNPASGQDVAGDAVHLPWATRVPKATLQLGRRQLVWQRCYGLLQDSDLVIVEQATRHLLNYLLVAEQRLGRRPVALWGHGRNFRVTDASRSAEWVKRRLFRRVHWWFAYTPLSADVVAATGFPRERVTVVQNAFDTRELAEAIAAVDPTTIQGLREKRCLDGAQVGLYIGGLFAEKRLDYLFAAADEIRAENERFALMIVGGGTERPSVEAFARTRPWVHDVGPCFRTEKAALLRLADVLLVPAAAGLVILDAFTAEVPLVISAHLPHGPEVAYLRDGVNALVVDDGGSAVRYGRAVAALLRDEGLRQRLAAGCRAEQGRYTVEHMVERFGDGVLAALESSSGTGIGPSPTSSP